MRFPASPVEKLSSVVSVESFQRALIIGLDMGDGDVIRAWAEKGYLPNLKQMMAGGAWFELNSTAEVLHTSTWPTFATGCLPGEHGVYYPYQPVPGEQQAQRITPGQYHRPSFWSLAERQGRRCIVYDVPETFPESDFKGTAIFEWGTWAWYGKRCAQPETLLSEIQRRFGKYPLKLEAKRLGLEFPNLAMLEARLLKSIEHKRASLQWLLNREDWDLGVAVFGETHPVGHYLWPLGVDSVDDGKEDQFAAMLRVYQALDRALGKIRKALPDRTTLLVVSGDGVRANNCGWHLLPAALERLGFTVPPSVASESGQRRPSLFSLGGIKALLPKSARRWIANHLPWWLRDRIGSNLQAEQIDWAKTRAFTLPTDLEGYIRINLKGREPLGIVEPEDYDALCEEIATRLKELTNPATGRGAVKRVWIRNQVYPGIAQEHLPDLMVAWDQSAPVAALSSDRMGMVSGESPDPRTGTHSTRGFLLACGPGIDGGARETGHLVDVAATILNLLGVDDVTGLAGSALPIQRGPAVRQRADGSAV